MPKCSQCGSPAGREVGGIPVCDDCADKLGLTSEGESRTCPKCTHTVPAHGRFCPKCGLDTGEVRPLKEKKGEEFDVRPACGCVLGGIFAFIGLIALTGGSTGEGLPFLIAGVLGIVYGVSKLS
jgi:hypothetical protein